MLRPGSKTSLHALPAEQASHDYDFPGRQSTERPDRLNSCLCTESHLKSPAFGHWMEAIGWNVSMHRKCWEFGFVLQALYERNLLRPGMRGLGFAVGQEPLPALLASYGCHITATDLDAADSRAQAWRSSGQHLSGLIGDGPRAATRGAGSIDYRPVDMNFIPADLAGFEFTWSTCSYEHCGSIRLGQEFIWNQMRCLKPGGVAVHTTEFNLTSNRRTIDNDTTVIFRRRDMEAIVNRLRDDGHCVEPLSLDTGTGPFDRHVDPPPYTIQNHLRLAISSFAATSIGLIVYKSPVVQPDCHAPIAAPVARQLAS